METSPDLNTVILDMLRNMDEKLDRIENNHIRMEQQLNQHEKDIQLLNVFVWRGDDNSPALTSVTERLESSVKTLIEDVEKLEVEFKSYAKSTTDKIDNRSNRTIGFFITVMLCVLSASLAINADFILSITSPKQSQPTLQQTKP